MVFMFFNRCTNPRWSKLSGFKFKDQTLLQKGWGHSLRSFQGSTASWDDLVDWFPEHSSKMSSPKPKFVEECAR